MDYHEFLEYIKENLAEMLGYQEGICQERHCEESECRNCEIYTVELHKVTKNNGIILDGIVIRKKGEIVTPNIYMESYYESYRMGKPISIIMEEIIYRYQTAREENTIRVPDSMDLSGIKNKIVLRLVNYERNKEQLKNCPYKKYLDLAVTFRYIASKDCFGIASSLITNEEFEMWKMDIEELYQLALFNTMREFPWHMDSLAKAMATCMEDQDNDSIPEEIRTEIQEYEKLENKVNMYILTNDTGINGATCILYDNVIKHFSKVQDSNIFILPSSIHEVMLVPEDTDTKPEFLAELVVDANQSAVGLIDLLSDHIYYYDRDKDQTFIYGQN